MVPAEYLKPLRSEDVKRIEFPELPFDIDVSYWMRNSNVVEATKGDDDPLVVDGLALQSIDNATTEEENAAGCYVDVIARSGDSKKTRLLLYGPVEGIVTATVDGKIYGFNLVREIWPMPFRVQLDKSVGEYYPGTSKPSSFMSEITRLADDLSLIHI